MRLKKLALVSLIGLPLLAATTAANADARFWRHAATLGGDLRLVLYHQP